MLQVVSQAEAAGHPILSERLLTDLIRLHDHPLRDYMTPYLERSVALFMYRIKRMQSRVGALVETGPLKAWQTYTQDGMSWWAQRMRGLDPPDDGGSKS